MFVFCVLRVTGGGCLYVCLCVHICVEELVRVIEYFCVCDVFEGFQPLSPFWQAAPGLVCVCY